jgi:hypothetical protein
MKRKSEQEKRNSVEGIVQDCFGGNSSGDSLYIYAIFQRESISEHHGTSSGKYQH